jgi:hypothetical protein
MGRVIRKCRKVCRVWFYAYPGRVGIMPEITVIELKKGIKA